jgi:hypothetical protein
MLLKHLFRPHFGAKGTIYHSSGVQEVLTSILLAALL